MTEVVGLLTPNEHRMCMIADSGATMMRSHSDTEMEPMRRDHSQISLQEEKARLESLIHQACTHQYKSGKVIRALLIDKERKTKL